MSSDPDPLRESSLRPSSLRTRRLILAPLRADHAQPLARLADTPAIARYSPGPANPSMLVEPKAVAARVGDTNGAWRTILLPNQPLGETAAAHPIGLIGIDDGEGRRGELGYWLGEAYWGHGYATEAVQAMVDFGFTALGHPRLCVSLRVTNTAARRVIEKCGFQYLGQDLATTARAGLVAVERFSLTRSTWQCLRAWVNADVGT